MSALRKFGRWFFETEADRLNRLDSKRAAELDASRERAVRWHKEQMKALGPCPPRAVHTPASADEGAWAEKKKKKKKKK